MKSFVSLEEHVCVVCGQTYGTGNLLLDRRLRERFDMHTVTGYGMCPDHEKLRADGFVALVEAEEGKSAVVGDRVRDSKAHRTGTYAHIKAEVFVETFGQPVPERGVCYTEPGLIAQLADMAGSRAMSHEDYAKSQEEKKQDGND